MVQRIQARSDGRWCQQDNTCMGRQGPWTKSQGLMTQYGIRAPPGGATMDVARASLHSRGDGGTPCQRLCRPGTLRKEWHERIPGVHKHWIVGTTEISWISPLQSIATANTYPSSEHVHSNQNCCRPGIIADVYLYKACQAHGVTASMASQGSWRRRGGEGGGVE